MKYKIIDDLTSDVMFEAYGSGPKDLFENAGEALFSIICKIDEVKAVEEVTLQAEGENIDELMINWLQELIALVDIEEMFFSKFEIIEIDNTSLTAVVSGEPVTPEKGLVVAKAVTYHKFKLESTKDGMKVNVVLDI